MYVRVNITLSTEITDATFLSSYDLYSTLHWNTRRAVIGLLASRELALGMLRASPGQCKPFDAAI